MPSGAVAREGKGRGTSGSNVRVRAYHRKNGTQAELASRFFTFLNKLLWYWKRLAEGLYPLL